MTANYVLDRLAADHLYDKLWRYLESESNLPGPRANLELMGQFIDCCGADHSPELRNTLQSWLKTPVTDAPVNSAAEYPVACAAAGLAAWLGVERERAIRALEFAAHDSRWRTREAVTIGLQKCPSGMRGTTLTLADNWCQCGDPYLERAGLVTFAAPTFLINPKVSAKALERTDGILNRIQGLPQAQQKTEGNQILTKALSFTISMFVASAPESGFAYMEKWLMRADKNTRRILNENLGKARLTKKYGHEVARLKGIEFEINDWDRH